MRILIKGAGDLASGIACRLFRCGLEVIMTELAVPTTVRRTVAFSRAVYDGCAVVEGVTGSLVHNEKELENTLSAGEIPIIIDPEIVHMEWYKPNVVVDAILAKRNTGTRINDADKVIGVGPGFEAGKDCHFVVETKRGHYLGSVIAKGAAIPNTGVPGNVGGFTSERIIRSVKSGLFVPIANIGEVVEKGQMVAISGGEPIYAQMGGLVRGMLQSGLLVDRGMKCGDIDARCEPDHCFTISDKARSIGGGVLEAVLRKV